MITAKSQPLLPPIRGGRGQGRRREQQHTEPEEISGKLCQTVKINQQYLAAGTAGTTAPQKAGYGAITDRAAG